MSGFSKILAGAVSAAILLAGSAASAAKYMVSFSGVMASGTDTGLFGPPGDLTGRIFVATYLVDTTPPLENVPGVYERAEPSSATLKIGDVTYALKPTPINVRTASASVGQLYFEFSSLTDANPLDSEFITNTALSAWFQPSLQFGDSAVIYAGGTGQFRIRECCAPEWPDINSFGQFTSDTVTITAVPEPATWAMMITGFGLAGASLRRRRAIAA